MLSLLQVAAASFVVVVMVVGVVVWELHSGREHLIFVSAKYSIILCSGGLHVVCKCLRAHGGCLGSRSR